MEAKRERTLPGTLCKGILMGAMALVLFTGISSSGVEAKRSSSTACRALQAGYEYADLQSRIAGYKGDKAGVAAWNEVGGSLGTIYLNLGCVVPDDETV